MSISIDQEKCIACGLCLDVCPGDLISADEAGKAHMSYAEQCWGCTACLKECPVGALSFFLGPDIGGKGMRLGFKRKGDLNVWSFTSPEGTTSCITTNVKKANAY